MVLSSFCPVRDDTARNIMVNFYEELFKEGEDGGEGVDVAKAYAKVIRE